MYVNAGASVDQRDLGRLTPASAPLGEPVLLTFSGAAADAWRDGHRWITRYEVRRPAPWRPWQRDPVVRVVAVAVAPRGAAWRL